MQGSALTHRVLDLPVDLGDRRFIDQGSDTVGGIHAISGLQLRHPGFQCREKRLEDTALDKNTVGADAGLAGVQELDQGHPLGRVHGVGIIEDDEGRMPTQFHRHPLELGRGGLGQMLADRGGASEGQLANFGVGAKQFTHRLRVTHRDQIGNPRRQPGVMQNLEYRPGTQGCCLGGFQNRGATGGKGGSQFSGQHGYGVIPGGDGGNDAHRLLLHQEALVGSGRGYGLAINPFGLLAKPLQEVRRVLHLIHGSLQGLTLLTGHQLGQGFLPLHHQGVCPMQHRRPLVGRRPGPGRQGGYRGIDPLVDLLETGVWHLANDLARGRVVHSKGFFTAAPLTVYVHHVLLDQASSRSCRRVAPGAALSGWSIRSVPWKIPRARGPQCTRPR